MEFLTAIPIYNEERSLEAVLNEVRRYSPHILVVNDGSTDHTGELLARQDGIRVVTHPQNRGYGAALLSRLVKSVVALESDQPLAAAAQDTIKSLGIANVQFVSGKLEEGAPATAPYDVILIEGAVRQIPAAILHQLADGGRLAAVVLGGEAGPGVAQLVVKQGGVASGRP